MFAVYKKLLYYVPKQRPLAYIAIGLTVVSTLLNVGAYYYLYEFLKRLVVDGDMGHAQYNAFLVAGLLIGGSLLYFAAVLLTHMLGFRLETNLRKRGVDGLTNASFRYFDLNSSGKTRKLIDDNAAQTHSIVAHLIPDNAGAILTPFLALVVGFLISLRVGIVLLVLFLLSGVLLVLMTGEKKFMEVYQKAGDNEQRDRGVHTRDTGAQDFWHRRYIFQDAASGNRGLCTACLELFHELPKAICVIPDDPIWLYCHTRFSDSLNAESDARPCRVGGGTHYDIIPGWSTVYRLYESDVCRYVCIHGNFGG